MKIPVEVSARHVHLSLEDLERLFGKEYSLRKVKDLSQSGEFASKEKVDLINGKKILSARVLGPPRGKTQVELSLTDARKLGILKIPVVLSGKLNKAAFITIKGPKGKIKVRAAIIAQRHLHCSPLEAKKLGVKNNSRIKVRVAGTRSIIFENVIVRISEKYKLALHLDTDEGNAAGIIEKTWGKLI